MALHTSIQNSLAPARPPVELPDGHVGLVALPGTSRQIWWTGRVAIGLRYERPGTPGGLSTSAAWIQDLLLTDAQTSRAHA